MLEGQNSDRQLTIKLFFYLEGDGLSGHLQKVDGFAQRLAFKTDTVDSQDPIPYVNSPCPGHTVTHTQIGKRRHTGTQSNVEVSVMHTLEKSTMRRVCVLR